jgi:hypothetical protein
MNITGIPAKRPRHSRLGISATILPMSLALLPPAHGADRSVNGYVEVGKREVFEDFDDEAIDDDYTFRNYHLEYDDAGFDRLAYKVSTFQKTRDYKARNDLDNLSSTYKGSLDYTLPTANQLLAGLDVRHKRKRFENSPRNEYDENVINPSMTKFQNKLYRLMAETGIDDVRYPDAPEKDERALFGHISGDRHLLDGRANLTTSYTYSDMEKKRAFRKRVKQDWIGKGKYQFDNPWIDKAGVQVTAGQRDSKEDEDYDIDYDYRYWGTDVETHHSIGPDTDASLEYITLHKNYINYNRDHQEYTVQSEWKRVFLKDEKARVWGSVLFGHRAVNFSMLPGSNLKRETVGLKAVYWRKGTWTATLQSDANIYDFQDSQKDKKRYNVSGIWDKVLIGGNLDFTLTGKYGFTEYRARNDSERVSVRAEIEYKL